MCIKILWVLIATYTFLFYKKKKAEGQVAVETLIAVIVLIFLLVMIIALNISRNENTLILEKKMNGEIECNKIAGILSNFNTVKGNAEITISVQEDFSIKENKVMLANWECGFYGNLSEQSLTKGIVHIVKNSAEIVVENV